MAGIPVQDPDALYRVVYTRRAELHLAASTG